VRRSASSSTQTIRREPNHLTSHPRQAPAPTCPFRARGPDRNFVALSFWQWGVRARHVLSPRMRVTHFCSSGQVAGGRPDLPLFAPVGAQFMAPAGGEVRPWRAHRQHWSLVRDKRSANSSARAHRFLRHLTKTLSPKERSQSQPRSLRVSQVHQTTFAGFGHVRTTISTDLRRFPTHLRRPASAIYSPYHNRVPKDCEQDEYASRAPQRVSASVNPMPAHVEAPATK
jgi:hypothetical protein